MDGEGTDYSRMSKKDIQEGIAEKSKTADADAQEAAKGFSGNVEIG